MALAARVRNLRATIFVDVLGAVREIRIGNAFGVRDAGAVLGFEGVSIFALRHLSDAIQSSWGPRVATGTDTSEAALIPISVLGQAGGFLDAKASAFGRIPRAAFRAVALGLLEIPFAFWVRVTINFILADAPKAFPLTTFRAHAGRWLELAETIDALTRPKATRFGAFDVFGHHLA